MERSFISPTSLQSISPKQIKKAKPYKHRPISGTESTWAPRLSPKKKKRVKPPSIARVFPLFLFCFLRDKGINKAPREVELCVCVCVCVDYLFRTWKKNLDRAR